jgi:hypothetical protein
VHCAPQWVELRAKSPKKSLESPKFPNISKILKKKSIFFKSKKNQTACDFLTVIQPADLISISIQSFSGLPLFNKSKITVLNQHACLTF